MRILLAVGADENIIDDPIRRGLTEHGRLGITETLTMRYLRHNGPYQWRLTGDALSGPAIYYNLLMGLQRRRCGSPDPPRFVSPQLTPAGQ